MLAVFRPLLASERLSRLQIWVIIPLARFAKATSWG